MMPFYYNVFLRGSPLTMSPPNSTESWRYHLRRGVSDVLFIIMIVLAFLLLLVLFGYHNTDPGWSTSGAAQEARHFFGILGAYTADALFSLFGYAAYLLPLGLGAIGWQSMRRAQLDAELMGWKAFALVIAIVSLCGILSLHSATVINSLAVTGGGIVGQKMTIELLRMWPVQLVMGIYTLLFFIGVTLLLEMSWLRILEWIGQRGVNAYFWLWHKVDGYTSKPKSADAPKRSPFAPEPETTPPMDDDTGDYRPKSDYFARRQSEGLPLRDEAPWPAAAANDAANDGDLDVSDDDFSALEEEYDPPPFTADTPEPPAESRNEPQLRVRLNNAPGAGAAAIAARRVPFTAPNRVEKTYQLPALDLLNPGTTAVANYSDEELDEMAMQVEQALKNYKLSVRVENIIVGPVVTCIELSLAPGIKVSSITNLERDIARLLSVQSVRVVEVIPGRPFIGLEIPNRKREMVPLRGVLESPQYQKERSPLTVVLGADISGKPVIANLGKMPHLLVAGTTGSGKSVGINVILASMLYKAKPDELKLILVDPKTVELAMYRDIPHLLAPVVTDMSDAENALRWAVNEMERRYELMVALKVRKLDEFNKVIHEAEARGERIPDPLVDPTLFVGLANPAPDLKPLPHIVIVIDELADMMMVAGKNVEQLIARIAQKARAAGIHMILATQRPSVDVITGLIKSNIPTRIAFQVSSKIDSRTILNSQGAESLLGNGDMLYLEPGSSMRRVHGAFIDDKEVDRLTTYLKSQGEPHYEDITDPAPAGGGNGGGGADEDGELDPLYDQAVQVVIESGKASISGLQRHLSIGYNRAARMVDVMERAGLVSRPDNKGIRKVLTGGGGGEEY